jgi:cbb3-type cytochrome oxidase subunit 3
MVFTTGFSGTAVVFWFLWKQRKVRRPEADDLEMQATQ